MTEEGPADQKELVEGESVVLVTSTWYGRGELHYRKNETSVDQVVDQDGRSHVPRWSGRTYELCPGVEVFTRGVATRTASEDRCLRIFRSACPVRVLVRETFEVRHYEDYQSDHVDRQLRWVLYEAAPGSGP
jgi:hypothetical protein